MFEFLLNAAYAQDAITPTGSSSGFLMQIAPLLPMFVIFYFFFIRPQRKRALQHKQLISDLKKGDQVVTNGGIIASVVKNAEADPYIIAEIAENMRIKLTRDAITGLFGGDKIASANANTAKSSNAKVVKAISSKESSSKESSSESPQVKSSRKTTSQSVKQKTAK